MAIDDDSGAAAWEAAGARALQRQSALPTQIRNNLANAVNVNPDNAIRSNVMARALQIPVSAAAAYPDDVARQLKAQSVDADALTIHSPVLARVLSDQNNANAVHPDVDHLAKIEQTLKDPMAGQELRALPDQAPSIADRVYDTFSRVLGSSQTAQSYRTAQQQAQAQNMLAAIGVHPEMTPEQAHEAARRSLAGMSATPDVMAQNFTSSATFGLVNKLVPDTAYTGGQQFMGQLAGLGGMVIGAPAKLLSGLGEKVLARGVRDSFAKTAAKTVVGGAIDLGAQMAGTTAGRELATSAGGGQLADLVTGNPLQPITQGNAGEIGASAQRVGKAGLEGAETGALFGAAGGLIPGGGLLPWLARGLGVTTVKGLINSGDPLEGARTVHDLLTNNMTPDLADRTFDLLLNFMTHGAGRSEGAGFLTDAAKTIYNDAQTAEKAVKDHGRLDALSQLTQAVNWRQGDPVAFKQFLRDVADQGDLPAVYVDAHKLAGLMDTAGLNSDHLMQTMPDVAAQMNSAMETNGMVRIPIEDYATHLAGSVIDKPLLQELRTDPDGATYGQAQEFLQGQAERMTKLAQDAASGKADADVFNKSREKVRKTIKGQLDELGRHPSDVTAIQAEHQASFLSVLASKMGLTPEEAHAQFGANFRSDVGAGFEQQQQPVGEGFDQSLTTMVPTTKVESAALDPTVVRVPSSADAYAAGGEEALAKSVGLVSKFEHTVSGEVVRGYDSLMVPGEGTPQEKAEAVITQMVRNLHSIYDAIPEDIRARSKLWYDGANRISLAFAQRYGISPRQSAAGLAVLSPQADWRMNVSYFERILDTLRDKQDHAWDPKMEAWAQSFIDGGEGARKAAAAAAAKATTGAQSELQDAKGELERLQSKADQQVEKHKKAVGAAEAALAELKPIRTAAKKELKAAEKQEDAKVLSRATAAIAAVEKKIAAQEAAIKTANQTLREANGMVGKQHTIIRKAEEKVASRIETQSKPDENIVLRGEVAGKKLGELDTDLQKAWWIRAYDEAHNTRQFRDVTPEGGFLGPVLLDSGRPNSIAWKSFNPIAKAIAIARDGGIENLHEQLGGEHKVRNFYNNIYDPNSPHPFVTSDTHQVAANLFLPLGAAAVEVGHNFGAGTSFGAIGQSGTYWLYSEAVKRAAEARGIMPREMQSISWEAIRSLFSPEFKSDERKVNQVRDLWQEYQHGRQSYEQTIKSIVDLAGGYKPPSWVSVRPDSAAAPEKGATSYESDVAHTRFGLAESGATPRPTGDSSVPGPAVPERRGELNQEARGSYNPATRTINLLKSADLSTYHHETAHWMLDIYGHIADQADAPPEIREDMDRLLSWFGTTGGTPEERLANWKSMSIDEQRESHEKFAEGFETYLFEGKAPSPELQTTFQRVRAWMVSIYKSIADMRIQLTPEVRGVYDRMLASDEAIQQAEQARVFTPVARPDGMSDTDWAAYLQEGQTATADAIDTMTARSLRDMAWANNAVARYIKGFQREAKVAGDRIAGEVTKAVAEEPIEQARTWLKTGEMTRDGEKIKAEKGYKLNSDAIRKMFPEKELAHPDLSELRGMTSPDGLDPDLLGSMFGFNSGRELIAKLLTEEPTKSKIEGMTDQRMLQEHGELIDPAAIKAAAEAAVHNDARGRFMATGLKILTKSAIPASMLLKGAREAAAAAIGAKKISELLPKQFAAAEAKANAQMLKLAPKDPEGAVNAQRAALLNNQLASEAIKAKADVAKAVQYMKRFTKDTVLRKMDADIRDQVMGLLDRFDFRVNPSDKETRGKANLREWMETQIEQGYSPSIPEELLNPTVRKHFSEMTVEEMRGLYDTVRSLEKVGQERRTITIGGKRIALDGVVQDLIDKMQAKPDRFTREEMKDKIEDRTTNLFRIKLDHLLSWLRGFGSSLLPQSARAGILDQHEILGAFARSIFEPVFDANYRKVTMLKELSNDFAAVGEKLGREWQDSLGEAVPNTKLADPDHPGKMYAFTRAKMLGLALHVGNESNFDKVAKGWDWDKAALMKWLDANMTAKDWEATQAVWDLYQKHWPDVEAMNRRLGNVTPDAITPRPFMTQHGEVRGGYAAIDYDALRSKRGAKAASSKAIDPSDGLFGRDDYFRADRTTNGSLNARKDGYTDRVSLDYTYHAQRIQETIHDLAYREALIDRLKIIDNEKFREQFELSHGREAHTALREWLGNVANQAAADRSAREAHSLLAYTRTGIVINGIGFRATTVLKHGGSAGIKTLGYFVGGGEKYLAARFARIGTNHNAEIASAIEKFPEIRARLMQQDRDYQSLTSSMYEPESLGAKAHRFSHAAVAYSDMITAVPTAWAAYDRAVTEGLPVNMGGTGKPMSEADAIKYASKVVREAHGSNIESARSNIMSTRSEAMKMFTTLYGFMNNTFGQEATFIDQMRTAGYSKPEALARGFMSLIVPALWAGYLSQKREDGESAVHWMAKAIAGEVAGSVMFVRDAWSMLEGHRNAGQVGVESFLATMTRPILDIIKAYEGHDVKTGVRDVADAIGVGLHLPVGQLGASLQYLENVRQGREKPEGLLEFAHGLVAGHS